MTTVDLHFRCTPEFCRAPLHPGPCAGWKSVLKQAGGSHLLHMARPTKKGPPADLSSPAARAHVRMMHVDSMKRFAALASRLDQMAAYNSSNKVFGYEIRTHIRRPTPESIAHPTDSKGEDHTDLAQHLDRRFHQVMTELEDMHDEGRPYREIVDHLAAAMAEDGMTFAAHTYDVLPADPKLFSFYAGEKPKPGVDLMVVDRPTILGRAPGDTKDFVISLGKAHLASPSEARKHKHKGLAAAMAFDLHANCSVEFCLNPLHPGPCKGYKSAIKQVVTGHVPKVPHVPTVTSKKVGAVKKVAAPHVPKIPGAPKPIPVATKDPVGFATHVIGKLQEFNTETEAADYLESLNLSKTQLQKLAGNLGAPNQSYHDKAGLVKSIVATHIKGTYKSTKSYYGYGQPPKGAGYKANSYIVPPLSKDTPLTLDYVAGLIGALRGSGGSEYRMQKMLSDATFYSGPNSIGSDRLPQLAAILGITYSPSHPASYFFGQVASKVAAGDYGPTDHLLAGWHANPDVVKAHIKTQLPAIKKIIGGTDKGFAKKMAAQQKEAIKKAKEAAKQQALEAKIAAKTPPAVHPVQMVYKQPTAALAKLYQAWKERRAKAKGGASAMGHSTGDISSGSSASKAKIFTGEEYSSLQSYAGSGYREINAYLRIQHGDPHAPVDPESPVLQHLYGSQHGAPHKIEQNAGVVRELDTAMKKSKLDADIKLWRGQSNPEVLFGHDWKDKDLTGGSWTEHGYSSTSAKVDTAQQFSDGNLLLRIMGKKGTPAVQLHEWYSEAEYMLPRGVQYKIIAHHPPTKSSNGYYSQTVVDGEVIQGSYHVLDVEVVYKPPTAEAKQSAVSTLMSDVDSGTKNSEPLTGGKMGTTKLLHTKSGAKVVEKSSDSSFTIEPARADAEMITSGVGRAIGAPVPVTFARNQYTGGHYDASGKYIPASSHATVYSEYIDGHHVTTVPTGDDALKLGLLDVLVINGDRTSGNYLVDDAGKVYGIDHGRAFDTAVQADYDPKSGGPPRLKFADFARAFIENPESKDGKDRKWKDNPLSKRDVEFLDEVLPLLDDPVFSSSNNPGGQHHAWHHEMMLRWKELRKRAKGTRDVIAPPDWKNKIQRRKEAQKKAAAALKKAAAAAPKYQKPVKPVAQAIAEGDFSDFKKIGSQGGSNPGGLYEATDGSKWYIKQQKSSEHARNEALAAALYKEAGFQVPEVIHGSGAPGLDGAQTATRWIDNPQVDLQQRLASDPDYMHQVRLGFAVDAWLANRDTAGLHYDNIITDPATGKPVRIDVGGSLKYRAQGQPKGNFGSSVIEWEGLRDAGINPQNAAVFGPITADELEASVQILGQVSEAQIRKLVKDNGFSSDLADTLIARRKDIQKRWAAERPKLLGLVGVS